MRALLKEDVTETRGGPRTAATSKMERFGIIVNSFQPLTIITKRSILEVKAVLDPPLETKNIFWLLIMVSRAFSGNTNKIYNINTKSICKIQEIPATNIKNLWRIKTCLNFEKGYLSFRVLLKCSFYLSSTSRTIRRTISNIYDVVFFTKIVNCL